MFEDLQQLVDPSRNMSKYRQHLSEVSNEPPVVPMYPVLKKDLTFSHEGNPTYCGKLVNFEKLRMIARAIRSVTKLCSVPYEISVMAQQVQLFLLACIFFSGNCTVEIEHICLFLETHSLGKVFLFEHSVILWNILGSQVVCIV